MQPSPQFVIDLTVDTETTPTRSRNTPTSSFNNEIATTFDFEIDPRRREYENAILLSREQDRIQFQRDRALAQQLQREEYSIQDERSLHSNYLPNIRIPWNIRNHFHNHSHNHNHNYNHSHNFNYPPPINANFIPPWRNVNVAGNPFSLQLFDG